jgi:hypothetical protein
MQDIESKERERAEFEIIKTFLAERIDQWPPTCSKSLRDRLVNFVDSFQWPKKKKISEQPEAGFKRLLEQCQITEIIASLETRQSASVLPWTQVYTTGTTPHVSTKVGLGAANPAPVISEQQSTLAQSGGSHRHFDAKAEYRFVTGYLSTRMSEWLAPEKYSLRPRTRRFVQCYDPKRAKRMKREPSPNNTQSDPGQSSS